MEKKIIQSEEAFGQEVGNRMEQKIAKSRQPCRGGDYGGRAPERKEKKATSGGAFTPRSPARQKKKKKGNLPPLKQSASNVEKRGSHAQ